MAKDNRLRIHEGAGRALTDGLVKAGSYRPNWKGFVRTKPRAIMLGVLTLSLLFSLHNFTPANAVPTVPPGYSASTFVCGLASPKFLQFGPGGSFGTGLYVSELGSVKVDRVSPSGVVTLFASGVSSPSGLAFSLSGSFGAFLYVGSASSGIFRVDSLGIVSPFSPGPAVGSIEFGPGGAYGSQLYSGEYQIGQVSKITSTGVRNLFAAGVGQPRYLKFDKIGYYGGLLYVSDYNTGAILKVSSSAIVSTFATLAPGIEGPQFASGAGFGTSFYHGNVLSGDIRQISTSGFPAAWASGFSGVADIAFAAAPPYGPAMYVASPGSGCIYKISPPTPPRSTWAPYGPFVPRLNFTYYAGLNPTLLSFLLGRLDLIGSILPPSAVAGCVGNPDFVYSGALTDTCALRDVGRGTLSPLPAPPPTGLVNEVSKGYPNFWTALNAENNPLFNPINPIYTFGGFPASSANALRWGETSSMSYLNPFHVGTFSATAVPEYDLTYEVYDTLLKTNPSDASQVFCWMCDTYNYQDLNFFDSGTGLSHYFIELRQNLRWHDDAVLNCNDVKFTLLNFRDVPVASPRWLSDVTLVVSVNILSSSICEIVMTGAPTLTQLQSLADVPIIPGHLWDSGDNFYGQGVGRVNLFMTDIAYEPIAAGTLIGSGPFVCLSLFPEDLGRIGTGCAKNSDGTRGFGIASTIILQRYDFTGLSTTTDPFYQYMRSYNINWATGPCCPISAFSGQFQEFSWADRNDDQDPTVDTLDFASVASCFGVSGLTPPCNYWLKLSFCSSTTITCEVSIVAAHYDDTWEWPYNWNPCGPPAPGCLTNIDGFTL